jgi:two-component system phosphate regulon response regulator OmpR
MSNFNQRPLNVTNEHPTSLLVVDDDEQIRTLLTRYLTQEGFVVAGAADGTAMDEWLVHNPVDLVILDLMLPGEDGLSLARRLRQSSKVPIVILSARGDDIDRIVGLEVGADDYLAKPFNPRELLARIRAVLRRRCPSAPREEGEDEEGPLLAFGPYRLDPQRRELAGPEGPLPLTSSEFDLLQVFLAHPNRIMNRDSLLDLLRGYERSPFDRSIDVLVARLRSKIEPDTKHPAHIRTVWGKGYIFTPHGLRQLPSSGEEAPITPGGQEPDPGSIREIGADLDSAAAP